MTHCSTPLRTSAAPLSVNDYCGSFACRTVRQPLANCCSTPLQMSAAPLPTNISGSCSHTAAAPTYSILRLAGDQLQPIPVAHGLDFGQVPRKVQDVIYTPRASTAAQSASF